MHSFIGELHIDHENCTMCIITSTVKIFFFNFRVCRDDWLVKKGCVYYVANQHFNFLKIKNCPIFATLTNQNK